MGIMEKLHCICKTGGFVKVVAPYFGPAWAFGGLPHRHYFTVQSFTYFDPDDIIHIFYDYTLARFKPEKIVFNEILKNFRVKQFLLMIANCWPAKYEFLLSHIFQLEDILFYLRKL